MKIVFLSFYSGLARRGAETFVASLSKELSDRGHNVLVRKNIFDNVPSDTRIIIGVNGRWDNFLSRWWCWYHGAKLIISGQSGLGRDDKLNLLLFPDVFVSLTAYQNNWAHKFNPLVKTKVIPNGVNSKIFNPQVKPFPINLPHPIVLNVGALETAGLQPDKGQLNLIKAAAEAKYLSVLLCGRGKDESHIGQIGRKLLGKRFRIISVPFDRMPGVYRAADIFAYPTSPWESFGVAILEAMASGLPVVATDDPIRREIVGSAGMFVDPQNSTEFSQAIQNTLKINWGDKPITQAQKFSWSKIGEDYDLLIKTLCSR